MATVGIWAIKSNLKQVINYTSDNNKTDIDLFDELHNAIDYIESDFKTEKKLFVTGINCTSEKAFQEMIEVKKKFHKEDGILGFHSFHSYKEGEVTPELAHDVGLQVANEMWGDRFQVLVSTHLNTNHIHNHFVINSVSFIDGKRYYDNRTSYAELRRISNEICISPSLPRRKRTLSPLPSNEISSFISITLFQYSAIIARFSIAFPIMPKPTT